MPGSAPDDGATTTRISRIAVGIPTHRRPEILVKALRELGCQTRAPDRVIICHVSPGDVVGSWGEHGVEFLTCPAGSSPQRNAILDAAGDCDVLLFLDDDFVMEPHYIEVTMAAMQAEPDIVVTTGSLIADASRGPGLTWSEGQALVAAATTAEPDTRSMPAPHGYGCNMAIRLDTARRHGVRFDEQLPLYAWSEDVDYTHRLGRYGRIVKLVGARGVHLGVKGGRSPGRNLGYSQVANPIYLRRKGSYSWGRALRSVGRNFAANLLRAVWSEPYVDRRGRLLGNGLAFIDLVRGRLAPGRILDL